MKRSMEQARLEANRKKRERYASDPAFRAATLIATTAYQRSHPETNRAATARWRAKTLPPRLTPEERFWAKVDKSGDCWIWNGARDGHGYGHLGAETKDWRAPRYVIEVIGGHVIPPGMHVCHHCDNPPCVNPAHLFVANPRANVADRIAKGRPGSPGPRDASKGERRWSAKLTQGQVDEIRSRYGAGGVTQRVLSTDYGVQQGQISRIIRGTRWT